VLCVVKSPTTPAQNSLAQSIGAEYINPW
jgi:hypothetical protein